MKTDNAPRVYRFWKQAGDGNMHVQTRHCLWLDQAHVYKLNEGDQHEGYRGRWKYDKEQTRLWLEERVRQAA